ncbi:nitrilase-related carbon-nitrogen hydrolase [Parasphingorhabdus sp. JC815]|uniref:nitrilase-related carbon-nitrogen hydrolase n=1 Tax=Parasphingorhabdus sp. JC815 TaxID=3232140 RepID=UPI0034574119
MTENKGFSRRSLFGAGAGIAATAALGWSNVVQASTKGGPDKLNITPDGRYATVPLAKTHISIGAVQSRVVPVELSNLKQTRRANVQHMMDLIDAANGFTGRKDLLFFHEFPITGYYQGWNLTDARKVAIEVPGEETEMLAKKAREYGCWLVFGSYVRDPDWPESLLSITTIMNDKGEVVDKHWKARNIKGVFGENFELFTTSIYDVLDRYVEMYGADAVVPVTRTPIGNIATTSTQREPELLRAMAMKGAEIMLRTATGGFSPVDMQATSLYNGIYTAVANNAASPQNKYFFEDAGGGGTAIYGPDGEVISKAKTAFETLVPARIPIADFRARHRQPVVHSEIFMPVYEQYRSQFGPNLFSGYQPKDTVDAKRHLRDKARWPK